MSLDIKRGTVASLMRYKQKLRIFTIETHVYNKILVISWYCAPRWTKLQDL